MILVCSQYANITVSSLKGDLIGRNLKGLIAGPQKDGAVCFQSIYGRERCRCARQSASVTSRTLPASVCYVRSQTFLLFLGKKQINKTTPEGALIRSKTASFFFLSFFHFFLLFLVKEGSMVTLTALSARNGHCPKYSTLFEHRAMPCQPS